MYLWMISTWVCSQTDVIAEGTDGEIKGTDGEAIQDKWPFATMHFYKLYLNQNKFSQQIKSISNWFIKRTM